MSKRGSRILEAPPAPEPPLPAWAFAARLCVSCGERLPEAEESIRCEECERDSLVALCDHVVKRPAWRVARWERQSAGVSNRSISIVALNVGDVCVYLGRFADALDLRTAEGRRLPIRRVKTIMPGTEIVERLTSVGACHKCSTVFFLPDCEIEAAGPPRILRIPLNRPTREYAKPLPDRGLMLTAYHKLRAEKRQ